MQNLRKSQKKQDMLIFNHRGSQWSIQYCDVFSIFFNQMLSLYFCHDKSNGTNKEKNH